MSDFKAVPPGHDAGAVNRYRAMLPNLENYRLALEGLITTLLASEEVKVQKIESRCKSVDGFEEKVKRKDYSQPFEQMTDMTALRVIVFFSDDVDAAISVMTREFEIDKFNTVDKRLIEEPDRFGYRSYHAVVSLDARRTQLSEWKPYVGLKAEVQIRTVLEHAWATIDHDLFYKGKPSVKSPEGVRRRFVSLMAQLEGIDEAFTNLRDQMDQAAVIQEGAVVEIESGPLGDGSSRDDAS